MSQDILDVMKHRRSVRHYTDEPVADEELRKVLSAGLIAPTGRNTKSPEFIVVRDRETLDAMAGSRAMGAAMLRNATAAIVVVAETAVTDIWIEDASIAMTMMHLAADAMGLGSCWIQGRLREAEDGSTTESYLRNLLGFPDDYSLEAILSLGRIDKHPAAYTAKDMDANRVHWIG